jgi:hypothetical protein|tara:strand:- start:625 stop:762 length:138 start_codon:yes stop_codon:yes gene_type:complete
MAQFSVDRVGVSVLWRHGVRGAAAASAASDGLVTRDTAHEPHEEA